MKRKDTSIIGALPRNQREAVERWLFEENLSYADCCKRLWEDFAVKVSQNSLSRFYAHRQQERLLENIGQSASKANAVMDRFAKNPANTYDALLGLIGQFAFNEMMKGDKDVSLDTVSELTNLVLSYQGGRLKAKAEERKERELQLKKEKLELEVRKYQQQFEKAKGMLDSNLTPDEKQRRLRQIFGMS
jgi:hypothetical protein